MLKGHFTSFAPALNVGWFLSYVNVISIPRVIALGVVDREPIFDFHVERGVVFIRATFRVAETILMNACTLTVFDAV